MYAIDIAYCSMNKYGEELCGDHVEMTQTDEGMIVVLSDGLGSGVKANILATLTSKIALTMLKEGASIEETIMTIAHTLPECQVRKLAYSTFTILKISHSGDVYMVEYDNPPVFYYRYGKPIQLYKNQKEVNSKIIYESNFKMRVGDTLTIVSDGAVHAGVGKTLNLGWQWEHIDAYLQDLVQMEHRSEPVSRHLLGVCENLYDSMPGDDTTIMTIKLQEVKHLDLFTGPPSDPVKDADMVERVKAAKGHIVLCGGTTANIVSRELGYPITIDLNHYNEKVPPMGYMEGVDFVTEGLLTLNAVKVLLSQYYETIQKGEPPLRITGEDGASKLTRLLLEESTNIHFWVGQAINPAHQNPHFPREFNLKNKVMQDLTKLLEVLGKKVVVTYM